MMIFTILVLLCIYLLIKYRIVDNFTSGITVIDIATGANHSLFKTSDNNVYACGLNNNGRSGLASLETTLKPSIIDSLIDKNITKIYAGNSNSFFIDNNGITYATGDNLYSQLGIETSVSMITQPTQIQLNGIVNVIAGWNHTFFLDNNNNTQVIGYNGTGQLGRQTSDDKVTSLIAIGSNKQLSTGWGHTLFLRTDNIVYSCGWNAYGQLGIGNTTTNFLPQQVQLPNNVRIKKVVAGMDFSMFITQDGAVYACGNNNFGQLGLGDTSSKIIPTLLLSLSGVNIQDISCNYQHTMFLTTNGVVYACGRNTNGQLGLGDKSNRLIPEQVTFITDVNKVCTGAGHTLFLSKTGRAYGCGKNTYGAVGTGTTTEHDIPVLCNIDFIPEKTPPFSSFYKPL